jgi:hypothetical protein
MNLVLLVVEMIHLETMAKYKITNIMTNDLKTNEYFIERKGLFGWKRIRIKENGESKLLVFKSYQEAEFYLIKTYCRIHGEIYQPRPNEYHYTPFSYY